MQWQWFQVRDNFHLHLHLALNSIAGRQVRACLDVFAFLVCLTLVVVQLGLLDYYYLTILTERIWYAWIAADVLVVIILFWLLILTIRNNQVQMEEVSSAGELTFVLFANMH